MNKNIRLATLLGVAASSPLMAIDYNWAVAGPADWATGSNWDVGNQPQGGGGNHAWVNNGGTAEISADILDFQDIFVGKNGGTGTLNQTAGSTFQGTGSWMFVGQNGGTGTYNLSGGSANKGRLYIGLDGANASGTFNLSGTGNVNTGEVNMGVGGDATAGTMATAAVSFTETGTVTTTGLFQLRNGTLNITDDVVVTVGGEYWVGNAGGTGVMDMDSGSVTVASWLAIGRDSATGTLNLSGDAQITRNGANNHFITIGGLGAGGGGTLNVSGNATITSNTNMVVGETTLRPSTVNQSGGTVTLRDNPTHGAFNQALEIDPSNDGDDSYFLTGGDLYVDSIDAGGGIIEFDGGTLHALKDANPFFLGSGPSIGSSGAVTIDTAGFDLVSGVNSGFATGGTINLTGGGSLSLGLGVGEPDVVAASDTGFGVVSDGFGGQLFLSSLTLGNELDVHTGVLGGFNPTLPLIELDTAGSLALTGPVTVNIYGEEFAVGTIPLLKYTAVNRSGSGSFSLGALPDGVSATIDDNTSTGVVSLVVTAVALPVWDGGVDQNWTTANNWTDFLTGDPITFANGNPVQFDDGATDPNVVVNANVTPSEMEFFNFSTDYTVSSSGGVITGTTGLTLDGFARVDLISPMANTFSGDVNLIAGTLGTTTWADAGVASPIGTGDLILSGGTFEYSGPDVTTSRAFTVTAAGSMLVSDANVTITGSLAGDAGAVTKTGTGDLTLTNANNSTGSLRIDGGDLTFDGSAGTQNTLTNGLLLGSGITATLDTDAQVRVDGNSNVGDVVGTASSLNINGTSTYTANGRLLLGDQGAEGVVNLTDSGTLNVIAGWVSIGTGGGGTGTLNLEGSSMMTTAADFNVSDVNPSTGIMNVSGNATLTSNGASYWGKNANTTATVNISGGTLNINGGIQVAGADDGDNDNSTSTATVNQTGGAVIFNGDDNRIGAEGSATWNISAGTLVSNGWLTLARYADTNGGGPSTGIMNVSGTGSVTQAHPSRPFHIGEFGSATLNVTGGGQVSAAAFSGTEGGIHIARNGGDGTVNLNGGTITASRVIGGAGVTTFNFNGGTLTASATVATPFFSNVDTAAVLAGGGTLNNAGQNIELAQNFSGTGTLTLSGAGTVTYSGTSTHEGTLVVSAGSLSLVGDSLNDASTLVVNTGATVQVPTGVTDSIVGLTLGGTVLPDGDYTAVTHPAFISGGGTLRVGPFVADPYDSWIATFYPGETDPLIIGKDADPDGDGQSNKVEFALGGSPDDNGDNAKVYSFKADTAADADTQRELVMTVAVRSGATFSGGPAPTATADGCTYTVTGSQNLQTFATAVTPVAAVTTGLPTAPTGYVYQSFRLDTSNGLTGKGFMHVEVQ